MTQDWVMCSYVLIVFLNILRLRILSLKMIIIKTLLVLEVWGQLSFVLGNLREHRLTLFLLFIGREVVGVEYSHFLFIFECLCILELVSDTSSWERIHFILAHWKYTPFVSCKLRTGRHLTSGVITTCD